MIDLPYTEFSADEMELRDYLSLHRTILANERTLLAYTRTAFALAIAGFTFLKLFRSEIYRIIGIVLIPTGILTFIWGIYRFQSTRSDYKNLELDTTNHLTQIEDGNDPATQ